ncbi:ABC transporter ATP-binding protein [Paraburkholderia aspalathi]|uniref:Peptide/nickel transport system ATP-binding protein n=1 Tax=Paraburkholderia aspalathi TaxID=1324617 RepID=A0A1I7B8X2_9BURK|nr:oligopeptide/dipeptide ABC transporter ATP-binding protein [Paraburkholderia aspalathi]SFT83650.1 peptide/nickel transport system ATP-binding protein [Paraburkholderia aspalathi]
MTSFLNVQGLTKHFSVRSRANLFSPKVPLKAVDDVSFSIRRGETLGVVGESGCGKSTTGRLVLGMMAPTSGSILLDGMAVQTRHDAVWRAQRQKMQMVYQDPLSFLDRRLPIGRQVMEPLVVHGIGSVAERREKVHTLMSTVGLRTDQFVSYPHELSGGQRQRVILARALVLDPDLVVCDEPVSALDVSVGAQVVNLLKDVQASRGLTYLFISHDLKIVRQIADRVIVMYLGKIMEEAATGELFRNPLHPYTQALMLAVPSLKPQPPRSLIIHGDPPNPMEVPSGCVLHPRCPRASKLCQTTQPELRVIAPSRSVACHHPQDDMASLRAAMENT